MKVSVSVIDASGEECATIKWREGSHYANAFDVSGREIDCFTFAWAQDEATRADFFCALDVWVSDFEKAGM